MEERRALWFVTATVASLALAGMGLALAGFAIGDARWVPAWSAVTVLYAALTAGLFARRAWAPALAQGAALFGVVTFVQSAFALWSLMPAIAVGLGLHVALGSASLLLPDGLTGRQRWSLRFAGAALAPAALFALAPEQSGAVMATVLGGAGLVWLGTLGVARGRTWGLLAALAGAPLLAIGVWLAPSTSFFFTRHFLVDAPLAPLMLDALGGAAIAGALLAVAPFVRPVARFVARGEPTHHGGTATPNTRVER